MENAAPLRNAPGDKPVAPIRFALVEDARELRAKILRLLLAQTGFESVGVFADGESAARDLPALHPHVVLMDIRLPGLSGVDCVRELKTRLPDTEFMMLTAFDDYDLIFQSLQAGPRATCSKNRSRANSWMPFANCARAVRP